MPVSRLLRSRYICSTATNVPEAKMVGMRKYVLCVNGFQGFVAGDEIKACLSSPDQVESSIDCSDTLDRS
jgi:hypothetical protein